MIFRRGVKLLLTFVMMCAITNLETSRIARQLKRILREQVLAGVDSKVRLEGYLTGDYLCAPFNNEVHKFELAPIWKADVVMMRLHYKKYHNGSGASVWAFSKKKADSGRQVYCLPESMEEFNAALKQHLEEKLDDWWYYESYILVPKAVLPKEFIELQRKLDNMIFPPRKKAAG